MKAYLYDENKYYKGEQSCQIDPLESEIAGHDVYLLPGDCTWVEPLSEKDGFKIKFNGTAWEYEEIIPEPEPEPHVPTEEEKRQQEIWELKQKLSETDYKIIKCSEAQMTGSEMPYDLEAVIAERDVWRARINELEPQ